MDKQAIMRKPKKNGPKVNVNIKISKAASEYLKRNNYSPTGIFNEALKELNFVEPEELAAVPTEATSEAPEEPKP